MTASGKQSLLVKRSNEEESKKLTFASAPPKLPKLRLLPCPCNVEGGLPPLAGGCGMGEGEVCGDVARGFDGTLTANESTE